MALRATDDFTDLVLHVLAHVRVAGPGNLFDARYVEWARRQMPAREAKWLAEATAVLDRAWGQQAPHVVHGWPELFGSVEELQTVASTELAALQPSDVRDPRRLRALQRGAGPEHEVLHSTLCLLAPWFVRQRNAVIARGFGEAIARVEPWLNDACEWLPSLTDSRVELAWALGGHGRVFERRIVVGAPASWNGMDERLPAVLAMHEHLVSGSGAPDYAGVEWEALTKLAAILHETTTPLVSAHIQWLGSLELRPLLQTLVGDGRLDTASARELVSCGPSARAACLASVGRGG